MQALYLKSMLAMKTTEPKGKAKGGIARAVSLTGERKSEIAKKAALARWRGLVLKATHGSPDHPLKIGTIEIPCYVLEDGTRVLSLRGLTAGVGMSVGGSRTIGGEARIVDFLISLEKKGLDVKELTACLKKPIEFQPKGGGRSAFGYNATILADFCDAVLAAREKGLLTDRQLNIASQCEILVRGFARVGIIALVDEATGFQREREKDALAKILEAFVAKELQPWVKTFPSDYYEQLFRLRGLEYSADSVKRPQYFGCLTNDIVYKRIAPGVLDELKRVTEKSESGRPKQKLFQRLTNNVGYPKLREHLGAVVATMQLSDDYKDFIGKLDRIRPKFKELNQMQLPLIYEQDKDDGKGL